MEQIAIIIMKRTAEVLVPIKEGNACSLVQLSLLSMRV